MSYSVDIYSAKGKKLKSFDLNSTLFNDDLVNSDLVHEYYLLQQSNARLPIAHTKTRAEVSGSGKKLFRQKGTGNARPGSLRTPIRRKGGVAFGPRSEANYKKTMNKKAKKIALYSLLTVKAQENSILGIDKFDLKVIKTKDALSVLNSVGLSGIKTLIVLDVKNETLEKSLRNIPNVKYILASYLNPVDLMHYDKVLFMESALEKINTPA